MYTGWHSWHHAFPFDYATSELSALKPKIEACKKGSFLSALATHA